MTITPEELAEWKRVAELMATGAALLWSNQELIEKVRTAFPRLIAALEEAQETVFDAGARDEAVARAAIAAMRDPTLAMCQAGHQADVAHWGCDVCVLKEDAARIWRAMIDAALSPAPTSERGES